MPKLEEDIRQRNQAIRDKTKKKSAPTKGGVTVRSSNKLHQIVEMIKQTAGKRLEKNADNLLQIRDEKSLIEYVDKIIEKGVASIDAETTGLDPIQDHLVGTVLYAPGLKGAYIPHKHIEINGNLVPDQLTYEVMARELGRMEEAKVRFVLHNAKFDARVFVNWLKVWITPYWDTSLASNFLNENEPHGLKALHDKYVAKNVVVDKELNTFNSLFEGITFDYVPIDIAYLYAAYDGPLTYELYKFQKPYLTPGNPSCISAKLEEAADLFLNTEMPLIPFLAEMEEEGVYINKQLANELSEDFTAKMKSTILEANEYLKRMDYTKLPQDKRAKLSGPMTVGEEDIPVVLNIGSPTQLAIVIYDLLGMKSPDRKKPRGTGEEILEALAPKVKDPIIKELFDKILEYRGFKKLLSTYVDKMPTLVKEKTGRLHGSFNQYGAKTGRFSSSDPNLQNIPARGTGEKIRLMFNAGVGHVLVGSDFSQQEPRVLAHLAWTLFGDSSMKDAYEQGLDLYSWTAAEVYKVPYDDCKEHHPETGYNPEGKSRRNSVKEIILGLMYGRGVPSIAEKLGWTKEKAQEIVDMFFNRFPAVKRVVQHYEDMARQLGYVQTVYGRKRRLPEINLPEYQFVYESTNEPLDSDTASYYFAQLSNAWGRKKNEIKDNLKASGIKVIDNGGKIADAERQTMNSVVQGTSADITKRAMVDLGRHKRFREIGARMVLTVHDELIARAPEEHALEAAAIMSEVMIASCADKITVGMKCDAEIIREWSGKDITAELEEKYGKAC